MSFQYQGIYYYTTLDSTTVEVGDNASYSESSLNIPSQVYDGITPYDVVSIGDNAFRDCGGLASVSFPPSLTSIGFNAFQYSGLASVDLSPRPERSARMPSTGNSSWSPRTPMSLFGCTATQRIVPSLLPVSKVDSSTFSIQSIDSGWPGYRSLQSPHRSHENTKITPSCVPASTLRPPFIIDRHCNSASWSSERAVLAGLRRSYTPSVASPAHDSRVERSSEYAKEDTKSSCRCQLITSPCEVRKSQTLTSPESSPVAKMCSEIRNMRLSLSECAPLNTLVLAPVASSDCKTRSAPIVYNRVPSALNCTPRHEEPSDECSHLINRVLAPWPTPYLYNSTAPLTSPHANTSACGWKLRSKTNSLHSSSSGTSSSPSLAMSSHSASEQIQG